MREIMNEKGQTMVEFALVITLFLAILFGIVEFGRAWYYSNHLGNSVRASARYGAVLGNNSSSIGLVTTRTETYAANEIIGFMPSATRGGGAGQFSVTARVFPNNSTIPRASGGVIRGDTLKVTAVYNYQILTGNIIPFFNEPRQIIRSASMPIELK